ncbi:hypothetical protein BS50DRAFT_578074 [Corynespora cassiicola Philippines]|uniref:Secreted protein n=1 Tax=Corynespora cassiicola Philippines TaxID=1448308 RepID=A0A2T2N9Z0_CORCC|nr:hypothetical protein BS50DRAFT_578074 [Corynespora cassiicola Philippines]
MDEYRPARPSGGPVAALTLCILLLDRPMLCHVCICMAGKGTAYRIQARDRAEDENGVAEAKTNTPGHPRGAADIFRHWGGEAKQAFEREHQGHIMCA